MPARPARRPAGAASRKRGGRRPPTGRGRKLNVAAGGVYAEDGAHEPFTIPTRWVKFVVALFLLPWVWIYTQAFFAAFADSTSLHKFWLTEEFWFFSLGCVLWLITFFGLSRPVTLYVFGHELTHALWVWLMGGRVSRFQVNRDGGQIETDTSNFWIALAPYFYPVYAIFLILLYGALGMVVDLEPYRRVLFALVGAAWGFHATFTCWMIPKGQSDLKEHGTFFSLVVIFTLNLFVLTILFVAACPTVSWGSFGALLLDHAIAFSAMVVSLFGDTLGRLLP